MGNSPKPSPSPPLTLIQEGGYKALGTVHYLQRESTEVKQFLVENAVFPNPELVLQCMGTALIYQKISFT